MIDGERMGRTEETAGAAVALEPDSWRIDELPDGWCLRFRPPLSGFSRHAAWLRWIWTRFPRTSPALLCVGTSLLLFSMGMLRGLLEMGRLHSPSASVWRIVFAVLSIVLSTVWYLVLFPVIADADANAEKEVTVRGGKVHVLQGVFPLRCLRSLHLGDERTIAFRGRRTNLVFRGDAVPMVSFAADMSHHVAVDVLAAVLARVAVIGTSDVSLLAPERSSR